MWRIALVLAVGCASTPIPAPPIAAPPPAAASAPATRTAPPPKPVPQRAPRRVAVLMLGIPYGDSYAPEVARTLTQHLRDLASAHNTLVTVSDEAVCEADERDCAARIARYNDAEVVIYGIVIQWTEGGKTEIHLASLANDTVRTWDDTPLDYHAFQSAMVHAYGVLVVAP